jgi:hypothetical protein
MGRQHRPVAFAADQAGDVVALIVEFPAEDLSRLAWARSVVDHKYPAQPPRPARHAGAYAAAKMNIVRFQKEGDRGLRGGHEGWRSVRTAGRARLTRYGLTRVRAALRLPGSTIAKIRPGRSLWREAGNSDEMTRGGTDPSGAFRQLNWWARGRRATTTTSHHHRVHADRRRRVREPVIVMVGGRGKAPFDDLSRWRSGPKRGALRRDDASSSGRSRISRRRSGRVPVRAAPSSGGRSAPVPWPGRDVVVLSGLFPATSSATTREATRSGGWSIDA